MWHEHGERDLDWLPDMQAERKIVAERLGMAAGYLTSVQAIAGEEFEQLGYVTPETRQKLSEAHQARFDTIKWMTDLALRVHTAETTGDDGRSVL